MLVISRRMVKQWCRVDGEPGYLLTTGAKVKQSAVKFEEATCSGCGTDAMKDREPKRVEAYMRRFGLCLDCHAKKLFPNDPEKQNKFKLNMGCKRVSVIYGARYYVDFMARTLVREVL